MLMVKYLRLSELVYFDRAEVNARVFDEFHGVRVCNQRVALVTLVPCL